MHKIDVTYDFRNDANGRDPDFASQTLKQYHMLLWSKKLPSGNSVKLSHNPKGYLIASDSKVHIPVSSDNISASFRHRKSFQDRVGKIPDSILSELDSVDWTIAQEIIFPSELRGGTQTINRGRGLNQKISDRFDLTLECIRRFYRGEPNPLDDVLCRYTDFFEWFVDFRGYINFFLLQDFVNQDYSVNFMMEFDDFQNSPLPRDDREYIRYLLHLVEVAKKRAVRIDLEYNGTNE